MTQLPDEYIALMHDPEVIDAVRASQPRGDRRRAIPLMCSGHQTGTSVVLRVGKLHDAPEVTAEHLQMYLVPDVKFEWPVIDTGMDWAPGLKVHEPSGNLEIDRPSGLPLFGSSALGRNAFTIRCGTCQRSIRREKIKLLRDAIKCVVKAGHRISVT